MTPGNKSYVLPLGTVLSPMEPLDLPSRRAPPKKTTDKRKAGDRFGVLNAFADYGAQHVTPAAQACWWIVFRNVKPNGLATLSHRQIAACMGVSRYTVARALAALEKAKLVVVVKRGTMTRREPSIYRVNPVPEGA